MDSNNQSQIGFKDRSRWLVAAGAAQMLLGGACGLGGALLFFLPQIVRQATGEYGLLPAPELELGSLMLLALGVLFAGLGIGTMRARRWARDLMLLGSWMWLIAGIVAFMAGSLIVSRMFGQIDLPGQEPLSGGMITAAILVYTSALAVLYLLLPGMFVWFYSDKNVRRTFEARDPVSGWTGKCPLWVLTLSQIAGSNAILLIVAPFYSDSLTFWGWSIHGVAAKLILALAGLVAAYLTWAIYKMKAHAWWGNLILTTAWLAWLVGACWRLDPAGYCKELGPVLGSTDLISSLDLPAGKTIAEFVAILGVVWLGLLWPIKKHFKKA